MEARRYFDELMKCADSTSWMMTEEELRKADEQEKEQRKKDAFLAACQKIPQKYREADVAELQPERRDLALRCIKGVSGFIMGGNGTGKSHFLWALYKDFVRRGMTPVLCMDAQSLVDLMKKDVQRGNFLDEVIQMDYGRFLPHLFIDELDKVRDSEIEFGYIVRIIDWRYSHCLQTIVAANGSEEEIQRRIPQSVYSRLTGDREGNFGVVFGGGDRRRKGND